MTPCHGPVVVFIAVVLYILSLRKILANRLQIVMVENPIGMRLFSVRNVVVSMVRISLLLGFRPITRMLVWNLRFAFLHDIFFSSFPVATVAKFSKIFF